VKDTNAYCRALGIPVPRLEDVRRQADANTYSLLIVALLERGEPITLAEAARRFEAAGIAPASRALASLKRCKPGRPPLYRDGDLYALDPYDDEADLWAFRLGLRPVRVPPLEVVRPAPGPLPPPDEPLEVTELEEAWRRFLPSGFSAKRVAICVLDAHGSPMSPADIATIVRERYRGPRIEAGAAKYWRKDPGIRVLDSGAWSLDPGSEAVRSARRAVRDRIAAVREQPNPGPDPAVVEAYRRHHERKRAAHREQLAGLRRVLVHAFPVASPEVAVLVDIERREITTYLDDGVAAIGEALARYDFILAVDVRPLLNRLGFDPGDRRLGDLGPPRKTRQINRRGRTLKITTDLLIRGSCGISRPFGDAKALRRYLREGQPTRLRRRLEADAKSLYALYRYGRLHGAVRLRWGFIDEMIPVPWVHRDELRFAEVARRARERGLALEVVIGTAPGWSDPWARARLAHVLETGGRWHPRLIDVEGHLIYTDEIQAVRFAGSDEALP